MKTKWYVVPAVLLLFSVVFPLSARASIATAPGYTLHVFAKAPGSTLHPAINQRPDSIVQLGNSIFIAYQNAGEVKDGTDSTITNDIVKYDLLGRRLKTYTVPGHVDGLLARDDLTPNQLWALANEDGNPKLTIINLVSGALTSYTATVNPPLHGGGYDDMQLINGVVYVSASNPTTAGAAPPTVVSLTLNANGTTFDVAPVLAGNAVAQDITPSVGGAANPTFGSNVPLVLSDPDSMTTDPLGNLVLDSQADGKLVFISNPGLSTQTASVLSLTLYNDKDGPTLPIDDIRFVPVIDKEETGETAAVERAERDSEEKTTAFMLFTDAYQTTYRLEGPFKPGDAFCAGQGQVMKLDIVDLPGTPLTSTGHLTPWVAGIGDANALRDPHGILFVVH